MGFQAPLAFSEPYLPWASHCADGSCSRRELHLKAGTSEAGPLRWPEPFQRATGSPSGHRRAGDVIN